MKSKKVRLSKDIVPQEYFLTLQPDLQSFTFSGVETIRLLLTKATSSVTLHSAEILITKAVFKTSSKEFVGSVSYNEKDETATIAFPKSLPKGKGELVLDFTGILNDKMRGFYRSKYQVDGTDHHMGVTQFEATDARRAFPCFDEPAQKAVFHVNLVVPQDHTAISNTIETEIAEHSGGYKMVKFAPTPIMSTYLLAFIVGKFEYIEKKTKEGVLVRVFVTPGKNKQAEFALDVAVKTLSFFTDYFKIPYPLPVMDLIAIPDFAAGAMENWGAVTYRETALLVDPQHSSAHNKQWVAIVIAHELAHQWFGNLVTMEWWTHLWLNEGFASYIEYVAVDHLFPEWDIWQQFVYMDHSSALQLDGLENTHPIEVDVHHPNEISEIFDAVSYSKGASVIRMLAEYLGQDNFRKGLQQYLKNHQYANASTHHLWKSLEKASGKPVEKIMTNWTRKAGYPLVELKDSKKGIVLSQKRFYSSIHSLKKSKDTTTWAIPISVVSNSTKKPIYYLMDKKSLNISNQKEEWIKLNTGETTLMRVLYSEKYLKLLSQAIKQKKLSVEDRYGIIRDAITFAENGTLNTVDLLELYRSYRSEDSYIVWAEIASQLSILNNLLAEEPYYELFKEYAHSLFTEIGQKVGWEKKKGESHTTTLLRSVVLSSLGKYGDDAVIEKAQDLFEKRYTKNIHIDSDLRGVVYFLAAENGDEKTYAHILDLYRKEELQEEKDRLFRALCAFKQKSLLTKTLAFSFTNEVRGQDVFRAVHFIWGNPNGRYLAWEFVQKKWSTIVEKFSGGHIFPRFIQPAEFFTRKKLAKEITTFFKKNKAPGAERTILQVVEQIESNDEWLKRDSKKIASFLTTLFAH